MINEHKSTSRGYFMPWGGRREGSGRKLGGGKFGEPTFPVRVPTRLVDKIPEILIAYEEQQKLLDQLKELLEKWDKKMANTTSVKSSQKNLALELWNELHSILEK